MSSNVINIATNEISGKVTYRYITKLRGAEFDQKAELLFSANLSLFVHSNGNAPVLKMVDVTNGDGSVSQIQDGYWQDTIGCVYFKDFTKNALILREFSWARPYLVKEPTLPKINWQIENENRKIGKFSCQKAVANFRGRSYTAWFAPDIPINDGPWKLNGLPGLILEAYDTLGEVKFLFSDIEIPFESFEKIEPPTDGEKISFKKYKTLDNIGFERMKRASLSQADRNSKMEIKRVKPNLIEREYE
jgi:GLPGLI family protein